MTHPWLIWTAIVLAVLGLAAIMYIALLIVFLACGVVL